MMPNCPQCGGSDVRRIAPGYFQCNSFISSIDRDGYPENRRCGHNFQQAEHAGAISAICSCGTFAIGKCLECARLVCGAHSELVGDRRLCLDHASEAHKLEVGRLPQQDLPPAPNIPTLIEKAKERSKAATTKLEADRAELEARVRILNNLINDFVQVMKRNNNSGELFKVEVSRRGVTGIKHGVLQRRGWVLNRRKSQSEWGTPDYEAYIVDGDCNLYEGWSLSESGPWTAKRLLRIKVPPENKSTALPNLQIQHDWCVLQAIVPPYALYPDRLRFYIAETCARLNVSWD